jgi:cellulose synthase/poly-beta-1,6-N-acetylglucosamine synthase-like glycosyltransferase
MMLTTIICAYNEENGIGKLLTNLSKQRLPPEIEDHEIIVVASGCTDRTVSIVERRVASDPRIRLIEEGERRGKASALNKALREAKGDVIAFVPADVQPARDGLYHLLLPFRNDEVTVVSGQPIQNPGALVGGLLGYIGDMTYRIWGRLMATLNDMGVAAHCSGEFMAMRAGVVAMIPEESAVDDAYISIAARRKGFIKYAGRAVAYNVMPRTLREYVNQRRRWLYGHFQTRRLTGEEPTVMDTIIFSRTKTALKILVDEIAEDLGRLPYLLAAVLVEGIIYCLSTVDFLSKRKYGVWPIIKSTKIAVYDRHEDL